MNDFKPGDKVKHAQHGTGSYVGDDEGWPNVLWDKGTDAFPVRPSELTPANPPCDAAKVRVPTSLSDAIHGPLAEPRLTVDMVREALLKALKGSGFLIRIDGSGDTTATPFYASLHAALTERMK